MRGIEPPCSAWEADILPLNYTCISERDYSRSPAWMQAPISKNPKKIAGRFPLFCTERAAGRDGGHSPATGLGLGRSSSRPSAQMGRRLLAALVQHGRGAKYGDTAGKRPFSACKSAEKWNKDHFWTICRFRGRSAKKFLSFFTKGALQTPLNLLQYTKLT